MWPTAELLPLREEIQRFMANSEAREKIQRCFSHVFPASCQASGTLPTRHRMLTVTPPHAVTGVHRQEFNDVGNRTQVTERQAFKTRQ